MEISLILHSTKQRRIPSWGVFVFPRAAWAWDASSPDMSQNNLIEHCSWWWSYLSATAGKCMSELIWWCTSVYSSTVSLLHSMSAETEMVPLGFCQVLAGTRDTPAVRPLWGVGGASTDFVAGESDVKLSQLGGGGMTTALGSFESRYLSSLSIASVHSEAATTDRSK